ncbi:MAG TPA: hypothetical protein VIU44_01225, partial [Gaiellaceae bacterium]
DGSGQTRLTVSPAIDAQPSWSPDGVEIAFVSERSGKGVRRIYLMTAAGLVQRPLTAGPYDLSPDWQPLAARPLCDLSGTVGDDLIVGGAGRDVLCGLGGSDVLQGLGGNDVLYGGPGNDRLSGGAGNDVLYGGPGDDALDGGAGADRLVAGPGGGQILGGFGNDSIDARNGRADLVDGGYGRDLARVDRFDRVSSVEKVLR